MANGIGLGMKIQCDGILKYEFDMGHFFFVRQVNGKEWQRQGIRADEAPSSDHFNNSYFIYGNE